MSSDGDNNGSGHKARLPQPQNDPLEDRAALEIPTTEDPEALAALVS